MSLFDLELSRESLEEQVDQDVSSTMSEIKDEGKAVREKEYTAFARILNFAQLRKANSSEIQEQYTICIPKTEKNAGSGKIRVRKITNSAGKSRFELTTKNNVREGKIELTIPTTESNFQQFAVLSETRMLKHRYTFKDEASGLSWEVDAVPDGNGGYFPWVRCEVEVKELNGNVPKFPLETEEFILPPELNKEITEEEFDSKTKPLMDKFFVEGNPYLKKVSTTTETKLEVKTKDSKDNGESEDDSKDDESKDSTVESKDETNTTGKESMSVENITDDKDLAEKVKARGEQIAEVRGDEDDDDDDDDEDSGEDDDSEDSDNPDEDSSDDDKNDDSDEDNDEDDDEGDDSETEESEDKDGKSKGSKDSKSDSDSNSKDDEGEEISKESSSAFESLSVFTLYSPSSESFGVGTGIADTVNTVRPIAIQQSIITSTPVGEETEYKDMDNTLKTQDDDFSFKEANFGNKVDNPIVDDSGNLATNTDARDMPVLPTDDADILSLETLRKLEAFSTGNFEMNYDSKTR